jgi:hypothetical protein
VIYLPSEVCSHASLPKDFTKDAKRMKALQNYKLNNPGQRYERIIKLMHELTSHAEIEKWGI